MGEALRVERHSTPWEFLHCPKRRPLEGLTSWCLRVLRKVSKSPDTDSWGTSFYRFISNFFWRPCIPSGRMDLPAFRIRQAHQMIQMHAPQNLSKVRRQLKPSVGPSDNLRYTTPSNTTPTPTRSTAERFGFQVWATLRDSDGFRIPRNDYSGVVYWPPRN